MLPTSPPAPVGAGARAHGMGGAFIAVADDATASSWNPGGLGQLQRPEISLVFSNFSHNEEYNEYVSNQGDCSISSEDLNYLSIAYAKNIWQRNVFFSLNYQKMYDFGRRIEYDRLVGESPEFGTMTEKINFRQEGSLYAFSSSLAVECVPSFYFGFSYNLWSDHVTKKSKWNTELKNILIIEDSKEVLSESKQSQEMNNFEGENWTLGFLWKVKQNFHIGGVYKTPFEASVKAEYRELSPYLPKGAIEETRNYEFCFPAKYGVGCSYRIKDFFTVSLDFTYTDWENFIIKDLDENSEYKLASHDFAIENITQRLGIEYIKLIKSIILPIRFGIFYDPEASVKKNESRNFYGVSIGSGITILNRLALDFAYQYRYSKGVNAHDLYVHIPNVPSKIDADVKQHFLFSSIIFYF